MSADDITTAIRAYIDASSPFDRWQDAAADLATLRAARGLLTDMERVLEADIANSFAAQRIRDAVPVEGVGVVQVRKGSSRKAWEHDKLAAAVIDGFLRRREGLVPDPWEMRDELLACAAVSYWRAGALRERGIDPDEYAETTPGRATVQITTSTKDKQ